MRNIDTSGAFVVNGLENVKIGVFFLGIKMLELNVKPSTGHTQKNTRNGLITVLRAIVGTY